MVTAERVAEVLDRAHDELLIHGWCQEFLETSDGSHCVLGAVAAALNHRGKDGTLLYPDTLEVGVEAFDALIDVLPTPPPVRDGIAHKVISITGWNDDEDTTIDDVLDLLRVAAKKVREGAS